MTWPDYAVLIFLLSVLVALGYWTGHPNTDTTDFFLARRQIPWWAAALSFVAAEVSAVTVISVPATAYMENWEYAQFFIGSALARAAIAYYFIPAFYRYNCTTIYHFLLYRFGSATQYTATIFFFITRLLASGVRLMAAALAVSVLMGWSIGPAIAAFTIVNIAYIVYSGVRAAVWTGVLQGAIDILAGVAAIVFLLVHIPGGWNAVSQIAGTAGHLNVFNWGPSWHDPLFFKKFMTHPNIFWIATLNGFFGSMAAFGTDHELMQRLLTVETRRDSQRTMLTTPFISFGTLMIYLTVGACLFTFYHLNPQLPLPQKADAIFPHFIGQVMPAGLRGFLLTAIVMAGIHSPLTSLTASFVTDIYKPLIRGGSDEKHYLFVSRICVGVFAVILALLAYGFSFFDKILWLAFKIGGVTFGSLLGVFLLGLLTTRRSNRANVAGMVLMAIVNAALLFLSEKQIVPLGWSWLVLIGTFGTMTIGYVLGPMLDPKGRT